MSVFAWDGEINMTTLLRDWLKDTFPKSNLHLDPIIYGIYTINIPSHRTGRNDLPIIALVLRPTDGWIENAWSRMGIWTRFNNISSWDTCRPVTVESPNFFYVLEETIAEEMHKWK